MASAESTYYQRRLLHAQQLAEHASSPAIREIHREMAEAYERRVDAIAAQGSIPPPR